MSLQEKLDFYRLNSDEFKKICELLNREPQGLEWALFSALWSEHCSYKSSKVHLKKFFSQSERVVEGFGENAGVIDLGLGERVAFKMESHNHPSFIEPYQGAATGVGGILRDIFTMGARPIACANYLCFGEKDAERMPQLIDGVVRGIGGYGNCVGVPTVTGQTEFHKSYNENILVNAFALGLFREGEALVTSAAKGIGNLVVYVGAKTGRDGVHGASMASESFDEESESKKPTVQIGDPFFEKLLIESCIEVIQKDLVVSIQDMGAAGITSSSFEMASKGKVGLRLELDKVPIRDSSITPEEILLSESQERMLLICEPQKICEIQEVFSKWNLDASVIGQVIESRQIELHWKNELLCSIDPLLLTDHAPEYQRKYFPWSDQNRVESAQELSVFQGNGSQKLIEILNSIQATSRNWIFQQYDQRVGGATQRDCQSSVASLVLPDSKRSLGIVLGCRPYMMRFDAKQGGIDAVAYPALELAAKGFEPLAVTDCLNFGNPEKPELMSEFVAAVEAMSDTCEGLGAPVISGNVSFYNETLGKNITSTPSTGLVGLRDNNKNLAFDHFQYLNDQIYLLRVNDLQLSGRIAEDIGHETMAGKGQIQVQHVKDFVSWLQQVCSGQQIQTSRVVGKYGVPYALARMVQGDLGCHIEDSNYLHSLSSDSLFMETCYEVIVTVRPEDQRWLKSQVLSLKDKVPMFVYHLGQVVSSRFQIGQHIQLSTQEILRAYQSGMEGEIEQLA